MDPVFIGMEDPPRIKNPYYTYTSLEYRVRRWWAYYRLLLRFTDVPLFHFFVFTFVTVCTLSAIFV